MTTHAPQNDAEELRAARNEKDIRFAIMAVVEERVGFGKAITRTDIEGVLKELEADPSIITIGKKPSKDMPPTDFDTYMYLQSRMQRTA